MPNTIPAAGEAVAINSTRRLFLAGLAGAALPVSAVAVQAPVEQPMAKARRLAKELSETLAVIGEHDYALIRPSDVEFPVLFSNRSDPEYAARFYLRAFQTSMEEANPDITKWTVSWPTPEQGERLCQFVAAAYIW